MKLTELLTVGDISSLERSPHALAVDARVSETYDPLIAKLVDHIAEHRHLTHQERLQLFAGFHVAFTIIDAALEKKYPD